MDQIRSVIRSLKRKREPESKDENEACKVLVSESEDENEACKDLVSESEDEHEAFKFLADFDPNDPESFFRKDRYAQEKAAEALKEATRNAWVEVILARCEVASLNDGCQWVPCDLGNHQLSGCAADPDIRPKLNLNMLNHVYQGPVINGVGARNPFKLYHYYCASAPDCPVSKEVQRCLDDPTILITKYEGTHNHPLPVRGITAMASTALSDGTSSVTQAYRPYHTRFRIKRSSHPRNIRSINPVGGITAMASTALSDGTSSVTQADRPYHACYLINPSSHPPNIRIINLDDPDYPSKVIVVDLTSNSDDPPQFPVRDEGQNQAPKILVGEDSKKDGTVFGALAVQSNSTKTSTSSSKSHCDYDVFLSFRGEDTRKNFTDHLRSALMQLGIRTFRDDEELPRGENISTNLLYAIRRSRIFIVIFSKSYVSSRWCLDELVEIVHCKNTKGRTLFPIFYHVDPSDVRNQTRTFAEAFARHEERFQTDMGRVQRWREALTEAVNCSGWDLESLANGYESRFIKEIVQEVLFQVNPSHLDVAKHPIGIEPRVYDIKDLLNLGTRDVRIVGIYGMGGIGKTTLAKAVYNDIYAAFEGSSFLSSLRESSEKSDGLVHLQEQLLREILKTNLKIDNVDRGINIIKERIHGKKILVILDDVDDFEDLSKLVEKQWCGPGSRIIVTTRVEGLLSQLEVDEKYKVEELNHCLSHRLFNWHAFKMANPKESYEKISIDAVAYAGGIPLALVVLGSFFKGRSISQCEDEFEKLRKYPHDKIQNILKISFDLLDDHTKKIFLDIACFFVGMDKDSEYIIQILDGCGFFPVCGIERLTERSLVTIDRENKFRMHGLIRDMGREIVYKESPTLPGERSRLWFYKDVLNVLRKHTGTKTIEGLILKVYEDVHSIETMAFKNMKNLRLLQIDGVHLTGSCEHLSEELRWLCWHECPLDFLPPNFHLENLVILDMQHSNLKEVWQENKILNKLKVLNLSNSKNLIKLPDFSQMQKLKKLILESCVRLDEIHKSIGCLKELVLLNLKGCTSLRNIPNSISNLESLQILDLSDCLKVDKLPEQIGRMKALTELLANRTSIKQLPSSFGLLENLETVLSSGCKEQSSKSWLSLLSSWMSPKSLKLVSFLPASVSKLHALKKLSLAGRNLSEDVFPGDFGSLPSLEFLDLSRNNFRNLPDSIGCLPKLYNLALHKCMALQSISGPFASVRHLYTRDCTSLERLSISPHHKRGLFVDLRNCHKLAEIQGLENWEFASIHNLAYDFRSHLQCPSTMGDDEFCVICFPGSEVPNWFSNQTIGSSISFHVPSISKGQFLRLLVCVVYARRAQFARFPVEEEEFYLDRFVYHPAVVLLNKTRGNSHNLWPTDSLHWKNSFIFSKKEDHLLLFLTPLIRCKYELEGGRIFNELVMENGDEIEVSIFFHHGGEVNKCGVHVVVDEPNVM